MARILGPYIDRRWSAGVDLHARSDAPCQRSTLVMVLAVAPARRPCSSRPIAGDGSDRGRGGGYVQSRRGAAPVAAAGAIWPPRMPAAGNFEEVPLGKWADYEERYLDAATIKERVALVAREGEAVTLETTTETRPGDRTVFATVFAGASSVGWRVTQRVPGRRRGAHGVARDRARRSSRTRASIPRKLIGTEMISVAGRVCSGEALSLPHAVRRARRLLDRRQRRADRPHQAGGGAEAARGFRGGFKFELVGDRAAARSRR